MTRFWVRILSCFVRRRIFTAESVEKICPMGAKYANPVLSSDPKDADRSIARTIADHHQFCMTDLFSS